MDHYSTQTISKTLVDEITSALKTVSPYGSVEIYVQDNVVTQITVRNIKKTVAPQKRHPNALNQKSRMVVGSY